MTDVRRVPLRNVLMFWAIALGGMAFDLATKSAIFARVPLGVSRTVIRDLLELHPSRNKGALWGLGSSLPNSGLVFAGLSIIAALAICYWLFVRGAATDGLLTAALGLIMAGALGNCYDRLVFGYVRDFAHLHVDSINFDCAIFNFADNMLIAGATLLVLLALRPEPAETEAPGRSDVTAGVVSSDAGPSPSRPA